MIVGLGTDLVEIARITRAMKNPRFVYRILTDREREIIKSPEQVAGRWAAKEAIAKAIGVGLHWQQVQILPDEIGVPRVSINSPHFDHRRLRIHVSITHERTHAMAVAILERNIVQSPLL